MAKFEELTFRRIWDFNLIPRRLFESIAKKDKAGIWNVDNLYQVAPFLVRNPLHHIYVMTDQEYIIHGVLWIVIDPISIALWVQALSVDEEYKNRSGSMSNNNMTECVSFIKDKYKDVKIRIMTDKDKVLERLGWKKLGYQLMEI